MARIRSIKPEFWRSPSTAKASPRARLLYIAMWNWADDYGVGEWTPRELLGFAFPNDLEITSAEFQCLCTEVATCFNTVFYRVGGRRFYCIPAWDVHQKNERRAQGKYPGPDDPKAVPDQAFTVSSEMCGTSVQTRGDTASGTGNREQGTGEQGTGNREWELSLTATDNTRSLDDLFYEAWTHWPKKVNKEPSRIKFKAAARKIPAQQLAATIAQFGDAYSTATTKQFTPGLNVWLSNSRWTDELPSKPELEQRKPTRTEHNLDFVAQLALEEAQQQKGISA